MKFDIEVESRQIFKCIDGTEYYDLSSAQAHNKGLKEAHEDKMFHEDMNFKLEEYTKEKGFVGTNRAQKLTIIGDYLIWLRNWKGTGESAPIEEDF
ncbi:MAG: hypothetical protein ACRC9N_02560 [Aeromonas sp.]